MDEKSCVINTNPDIIGIGVRLSLYILSLAGPTVGWAVNSAEFTRSINSSLGLNGLALFLATVISAASGTIALFHAICIFHLLALAGITIQPRGSYKGGRIRFWTFSAFYVVAVGGSLSFFIYVFATAPAFGNQPECNSRTIYVLFGYNISATNVVFRWIFVAACAVILAGFVLSILIMSGVACCLTLGCCSCCDVSNDIQGSDIHDGRRRGFPYHLVGHLFASSYFIAMLELMLRRNDLAAGTGEWGFGQLLAMALLLGPITELLALFVGWLEDEPDESVARRA